MLVLIKENPKESLGICSGAVTLLTGTIQLIKVSASSSTANFILVFFYISAAITIGFCIHFLMNRRRGRIKSLEFLSNARDSQQFLNACKECKGGIFLNVKIDFNNWFTPVLQSHLAYQDVAVRFKQLRALKCMDTGTKACVYSTENNSLSLGSPLKRILFLTTKEERRALTVGSGKLESERCALERCHWAMGIPISFVTATRLINLFSGELNHETEIYNAIIAYRDKVKDNRYLWELLGFEWKLFTLFDSMLYNKASPEDRKEARRLFDHALKKMRRDSAIVGKDRVIGTIDCAVLDLKSGDSLWGAAFVEDKGRKICCYYELCEKSLRRLQKKCDLYENGSKFEIDGNSEKLEKYKEALIEFASLAEKLSFVSVNSVITEIGGHLPQRLKEQSEIDPAIQVWMEYFEDHKTTSGETDRLPSVFHDDFVYVNRNH